MALPTNDGVLVTAVLPTIRDFGVTNVWSRESWGDGWRLSITLHLGVGDTYVMGTD